jgi:hypothetical protein
MNYIIEDNKINNKLVVRCIKNGNYTILSVGYDKDNKAEMLKMILDYVSKLENNVD